MTNIKSDIFLIDSSSYFYRAFYALPPLANSKGFPTGAILGYTKMLMKLMTESSVKYGACLFDSRKSLRKESFKEYKANRKEMPEDLVKQVDYIYAISDMLGFNTFKLEGYEADDLIAYIVKNIISKGSSSSLVEEKDGKNIEKEKVKTVGTVTARIPVCIITGDKDLKQLLSENVCIYDAQKDKIITAEGFEEEFGIKPFEYRYVLALMGDGSDNIPGIKGIGEKTAFNLIRSYGSLDGIYENIPSIKQQKLKEILIAHKDDAYNSLELASFYNSLPFNDSYFTTSFSVSSNTAPAVEIMQKVEKVKFESINDFALKEKNTEGLAGIFKELEFKTILNKGNGAGKDNGAAGSSSIAIDEDKLWIYAGLNLNKARSKNTLNFNSEKDPEEVDLIYLFSKKTGAFLLTGGELDKRLDILSFLQDGRVKKIGFDLNGIRKYFKRRGSNFMGQYFDLQLASYLFNPVRHSHNFSDIYNEFSVELKEGFKEFDAAYDPENKAAIVYKLYNLLLGEIEKDNNLRRLFFNVDMPLSLVLGEMEETGFMIDKERLIALSSEFEIEAKRLSGTVYKIAGAEFNINSPKQLSEIMFERLNFRRVKKNSTDAEVLQTLKSEIESAISLNEKGTGAGATGIGVFKDYVVFIDSIISYRNKIKLKTSFTDVLIKELDNNNRVHTSFSQVKTSTGRLSSQEPNLQNIPISGMEGAKIRQAFIAPKGKILVSADYSQIDLRVMAEVSGDELLIQSFKNSEDIHSKTASEIFRVDPSDVTQQMRRRAKVINFGIIYGMSPYGLSKELAISSEEAKTYIDLFFQTHPQIKQYMESIVKEARKNGYVKTVFGRKCYIKDINSKIKNLASFAERAAINAPIQGTAADIIKIVMINIDKELKIKGIDAKMILQVHDELIFEADPSGLEELLKVVVSKMTDSALLKNVPLAVNTGYGKNWDEAHS